MTAPKPDLDPVYIDYPLRKGELTEYEATLEARLRDEEKAIAVANARHEDAREEIRRLNGDLSDMRESLRRALEAAHATTCETCSGTCEEHDYDMVATGPGGDAYREEPYLTGNPCGDCWGTGKELV